MKNLEKKIICMLAVVFFAVSCVASIFSFYKVKDLDKATTENHPFNTFFLNTYGKTTFLLGKSYNLDAEIGVYRLRNNYLAYERSEYHPAKYEKNLANFNTYLEDLGVEYMYVMTSEAGDERLGQLPFGIKTNYCEETFNELIDVCKRNNIDYLNTFDYLTNAEMDYYDYFYKTDHHWNDYAGVYIAKVITEQLNKKYGFGLSSSWFDLNQYTVKSYENMFLGACGKKTAMGYVDPEDFDMLLPKYETDFKTSYGKNGSYWEAFIYEKPLRYDPYVANCYASYLYGDNALITIRNMKADNNKRILVLKDSKANVVNCHLASAVEWMDIIDLRLYNKNLKEYIKKTKPDAVLMIQSPFATSGFYKFG